MGFLNKIRRQKLLSLSLLLFTLSLGIVLGTLMQTGVNAAKSQAAAADATPLVIPPAAKLPKNEFVELAHRLEPSVVNISTDYVPKPGKPRRGAPGEDEDDESMDLFRRFFRNGPGGETGPMKPNKRHATGSGFLVDKNGYVMTNYHVVEKADNIKVKMSHDDGEYRARMIGYDEETDLAILKIDAPRVFSPARVGNSDSVQVGDWAVAIGSPFGLEATVTAGIVSATGRDIEGARQFQHFIQTDAAINPGNSGGPLLNINGEVIGINTAIATQSGGYQGIGFALPINMAVQVYNSIIKTGRMSRGSIGIQFTKYEKSAELMKGLGLKEGVIVERVNPGGPADKAGMKGEDVIVTYNGKPVKNGEDLVDRVSMTPIGAQATLTVDRNGKKVDLKLTIADREEQAAALSGFNRQELKDEEDAKPGVTQAKFGIGIKPLTEVEREAAKVDGKSGVVITQVQDGSFAEDVGLQEKDIIISINRQPVATTEEVRALQAKLKPGDAVAFRIMRPAPMVNPGRRNQTGTTQYFGQYLAGTLPPQ